MSIQRADELRRELTDKYVVVADGAPELRRFTGLTGQIKTVNMNGRALVQFDGPADIGWYDIDPSYLTLVSAPVKKPAVTKAAPAAKTASASAPPKPAGKSPIEMARAQDAAKAAPADSGKKLSPLELARQQGAAKSGGAAAPAEKPAPAAASSSGDGKKLSPLELARMQGAAKPAGSSSAAPAAETPAPEPETPKADEPAPATAAAVDASNLTTEQILALCREQGAFKG